EVEGWPMPVVDEEIEEIAHAQEDDAIVQVAESAGQDEPQRRAMQTVLRHGWACTPEYDAAGSKHADCGKKRVAPVGVVKPAEQRPFVDRGRRLGADALQAGTPGIVTANFRSIVGRT